MRDRTILVVDDDPRIRALLRACFEAEGARVREAADAAGVAATFRQAPPDLVTLDLALGRDNGLEVAREIRRAHDTPIIMLTGKGEVIDRVVGLEIGADDYVAKPFHVREIVARANSVLRRYDMAAETRPATAAAPGTVMLDGLHIDLERMAMQDRDGHARSLTTADFKLLRVLIENAGRALSRDRLMDLIDGPAWAPMDRTIDNRVARLRKKIERDPSRPALIRTVRGIGYMLTEPGEPVPARPASRA